MNKTLKNPPLKKVLKEYLKMQKEEEKMMKQEEKQRKKENKLNKTMKKREKKVGNNIVRKKTAKKRVLIIEDSSSFSPSSDNKEKDLKESSLININMESVVNYNPVRLNEKFIELLDQLSSIMLKQGEQFRARAYQKAQETIMSMNEDIVSLDQLKGKPNIGSTIMEKLDEYMKTGTLKVIEREKNNPVNILGEIYGVGPKKAQELVSAGISTIAQLRANQDSLLNATQKTGLRYYEDILKRIPRSEIVQYDSIFNNAFNHIATGSDCKYEIVGSYRRGAQTSGDIDVIITSLNHKVFVDFVDYLIKEGIILEVLSRGPSKCLVIAKILGSDTARRVDFLYATPDEFPFSILYFTGSKIFNTVMRHQALNMDLTMNEHGIYSLVGKKKEDKVNHKFNNERDIFDYLGLEYKEPIERVDGRSVILKNVSVSAPIAPINMPIINDNPLTNTLKVKPIREKKSVKTRKLKIEEDEKEENNVKEETKKESFISSSNPIVLYLINDFKKNGISVLEQATETQLSNILREANKLYYNSQPVLSDNQYDIIKDFIQKKYPSNSVNQEIGAPIERNKVELPYFMGSMDKIKPDTGALVSWSAKYKGPYVISCKLDGVSGLYTTEGSVPKLYTRGNGTIGQDISHFIPYLRLPKTKGIVIRGEFIVLKSVFNTKYKNDFANSRNMVAGIINQKSIDKRIQDVNFVAYEVIKPAMKPSDQMGFLGKLNVDCVLYRSVTTISNDFLSNLLVEWREKYEYEIDGIIVVDDKIHERNKDGNPEYAFAFKMVLSDQIAEAKVVDVIWTPSKDGYLKPRVRIEPIQLGGVQIEYATGFNAAFIKDNNIGIGSIIEIIRSGDVIPHIKKVTMGSEQPKMPSVPFKWNDTHVDIMLENIDTDETVREKVVAGFFRGIGVEGLSSGNIARIISAGFDTVPKILDMSIDDFLTVDGFKIKTATKLFEGIREKLEEASIITLMSASNIFGRGFSSTKIELVMNEYPNILVSQESVSEKVKKVTGIKGMALKSAEAFVSKIGDFIAFIQECGLQNKLAVSKSVNNVIKPSANNPLFGKTIVMTGFRNKDIEQKLKEMGAKLGSSVSKNTFLVLVKNLDEDTGKAMDAKNLGIQLMTPEDFIAMYF